MITAHTNKHYVVGIGASAGGVDALHDLFDNLPADTGFSFVLIQHLSPDYKSLMVELLSKHTAMTVVEAGEGMILEPNHIYLLPRKKLMTLRNGQLWLHEKNTGGPNFAIDAFFESLAIEKGKDAVGIILSGTGTDGTKGIEAIKGNGGIVIVQDPQSADFDGMPNSAIATGVADAILPVEAMGVELQAFLREAPFIRALNPLSPNDEAILKDILEKLNQATQHDFFHYKRPTLFRRLAKRMLELSIGTLQEYHAYIAQHEAELEILGKEFLINVTRFFRDKEGFDALQEQAIVPIVRSKDTGDTIKVWVAACSSGEEAYSVAMLLLEEIERIKLPLVLKVFATDIDDEALETASRGVYGEHIRKDVPSELLNKYFIPEGESYRVSPSLRKAVVFANHNLLKDPPFSKLDLITCRNIFIYLNTELQTKALRRFHFALNVDSFLMLGPSETIGVLKDSVEEVNRKWRLYRCTTKARMSDTIMVPLEHRSYASGTWQQRNKAQISKSLMEAFKDTITQERKIAGIFIDPDYNIRQATGNFKHFLAFQEENFYFNLLKLVSPPLAVTLGICIRKAVSLNERVVMKHVLEPEAGKNSITITAKPFGDKSGYQQPFICVVLEEETPVHREHVVQVDPSIGNYERILELEQELRETRENLQAIIEETESTSEEAQSSNEELISTNEELQSTNEELQSLNEELHTVSGEHQLKIKELLELNDDLNNYFNTSHIGQIQLDRKLIIRRFSPSVKQIVNLIDSDIGRSINDITTNIKGINLVDAIEGVINTGNTFESEISIHDKSFLIVRILPYVRHNGEMDGVSITFVDITEMRRLSSIVEGIFHGSTNGITAKRAIRDADGNVVDLEYIAANETMLTIFGKAPRELIGKSMLQTVPEKEQFLEAYKHVIETGEPTQLEFHREADDRWFDMVAVKMLDGVVTTFTDITDKRRAANIIAENYETLQSTSRKLEESNLHLERSNFDLLQFASVASHDLKEPLRKIQAFGNILQSKISEKLTEPEQGYLSKIISASGRMQTLIEDVLTLSKLSNSELHKEPTDLNRIVTRICDDLDIAITEKNAVIQVSDLPAVKAVPGQMRQLFQNLIANALKFNNKPEPVVRIEEHALTAEQTEEYGINEKDFVCISLRDNGIGFEDEYRQKIFGVFQRLHGRNYEGTGIGLSIAKKIVEMHGGIIDAKGVVNEGATFYIVLPLNGVSVHASEETASA